MRHIVAYDESGYTGEYEYRYDPTHSNRPKGGGWYLTRHGWARGSSRTRGHIPSNPIKTPSVVKASPEHRMKIARCSKSINTFVSSGVANCFSASDEVVRQLGDHRNSFREIDDLILGYADREKPKVSHHLSAIMGYLFHLSPDFRNDRKPIPKYCEETVSQMMKYIANEQEIIRMSGLVNEDDTITLFRNTDNTQFRANGYGSSDNISYRGNNFESWSTNPGLKFTPDGTRKSKVMARVPLHACIASCIGRRERPFMFKHRGECEVMVCAAFIRNVTYVGDSYGIKLPHVRETYLEEARSNMQRFTGRDDDRKASRPFNRRRVARELLRIVREIIELEES